MNKFFKTLGLIGIAALFAGCTLMLDEPADDGNPAENGDGFTSPRTETNDLGTITYQYGEDTKLLDDRYRPYILRYSTDSLYDKTEIYFTKDIPADLMVQKGNYLATTLIDIFDKGLCHEVVEVQKDDLGYRVLACVASTKDVYKKLKVKADFYVEVDQDEQSETQSRTGDFNADRVRLVGAAGQSRGGEIKLNFINVGIRLTNMDLYYSPFKHISTAAPLTFNNLKGKIHSKVSGDADVYAEFSSYLRITYESDDEKNMADWHGIIGAKVAAGAMFKKARVSMSIPLAGCSYVKYLPWGDDSPSSPVIYEYDENGYLYNLHKIEKDFIIGGFVGTFFIEPNLILDIFGGVDSDTPEKYEYTKELRFVEFGFHSEPGNEYSYPNSKSKPDDVTVEHADGANFETGARLSLNVNTGFKAYKVVKAYISFNTGLEVKYQKHLASNPDKADKPIKSPRGEELRYPGNSSISISSDLDMKLSGEVDLGFYKVPLFSLGPTKPFDLFKVTWYTFPFFETHVYLDKERSDNNTNYYKAVVRKSSDRKFLFGTFSVPPYLAIYDSKFNLVCKGEPVGETKFEYEDKDYNFEFSVNLDKTGANDFYYAIPYDVTDLVYSTPYKFYATGNWLNVTDALQMEAINFESFADPQYENITAFRFETKGNIQRISDKLQCRVTVYNDKNKVVSTKSYAYPRPASNTRYQTKSILLIKHSLKVHLRKITIEFFYIDSKSGKTVAVSDIYEHPLEDFGDASEENILDLHNVNKWIDAGFQLLQ